MNDDRCIQVGMLSGGMFEKYESSSRVYSSSGISPTLNTCEGGHREVKIIEDTTCEERTDEGIRFFQDNICGSLRTTESCGDKRIIEPCIAASRGRNPKDPSVRAVGAETEQRLEINEQGTSSTLTSVQKDNLVVEPKLVGGIGEINWGKQYHQGNRIYDSEEIAMCLNSQPVGNTGGNSYLYQVEKPTYRIRKLTPKECIRLMDFDDSDYDKIKAIGMSDSQIYKQCGNSIVVACLSKIFDKMFINTEVENEQLSLF